MAPTNRSVKTALSGAAVCGAAGIIFLVKSFYGQISHELLPAGRPGAPLMTPQQGYVVSLLFFALAAYALFLAYRARGKSDD